MKFKVEIFTQEDSESLHTSPYMEGHLPIYVRCFRSECPEVIDQVTGHDVERTVMVPVARHCLIPAEIICQCHNPRTAFFNVPSWSLLIILHFRFFAIPSHDKHNILDG